MVSTSKSLMFILNNLANNDDSPEWGRLGKQIYGKGQRYHWESSWAFGTI